MTLDQVIGGVLDSPVGRRIAARAGLPVAAVNLGRTRADALLSLKIEQPCAQALGFLLDGTKTQ